MLVRWALERCCNQILCIHTESGITWNSLQFMSLFTAMEGECLNCGFKITQSRDNCRFYYNAFSKTLFASNTPILWGNKTAHLHFLAGATFTHLGLSLASLNVTIVTAVILSVAVGMPKWVNSYRWLSVCTIKGLLKQIILTLNVKNAREISSMTRQKMTENSLQHNHQLSLQLLCSTILTESVQLLDIQWETEAKVWAGFHKPCLDKRPFEKQLSQHCLFSPGDYATSDPPRSHQRPQIEIPGPYSQSKYTLNFKHMNSLTIVKCLKVGSIHNFKLQYRLRTFAEPQVLQKDHTWNSMC